MIILLTTSHYFQQAMDNECDVTHYSFYIDEDDDEIIINEEKIKQFAVAVPCVTRRFRSDKRNILPDTGGTSRGVTLDFDAKRESDREDVKLCPTTNTQESSTRSPNCDEDDPEECRDLLDSMEINDNGSTPRTPPTTPVDDHQGGTAPLTEVGTVLAVPQHIGTSVDLFEDVCVPPSAVSLRLPSSYVRGKTLEMAMPCPSSKDDSVQHIVYPQVASPLKKATTPMPKRAPLLSGVNEPNKLDFASMSGPCSDASKDTVVTDVVLNSTGPKVSSESQTVEQGCQTSFCHEQVRSTLLCGTPQKNESPSLPKVPTWRPLFSSIENLQGNKARSSPQHTRSPSSIPARSRACGLPRDCGKVQTSPFKCPWSVPTASKKTPVKPSEKQLNSPTMNTRPGWRPGSPWSVVSPVARVSPLAMGCLLEAVMFF